MAKKKKSSARKKSGAAKKRGAARGGAGKRSAVRRAAATKSRRSSGKRSAKRSSQSPVARVRRVTREVVQQATVAVAAGVETLKDLGGNLVDRMRTDDSGGTS